MSKKTKLLHKVGKGLIKAGAAVDSAFGAVDAVEKKIGRGKMLDDRIEDGAKWTANKIKAGFHKAKDVVIESTTKAKEKVAKIKPTKVVEPEKAKPWSVDQS
jgi:hypothetical protein